jgi:hypothetical protein
MGSFQVCDALSIFFKLEKSPIEHLEGFILLPKEGGELHNFFRIFNQKFELKNSKEFPHWISKSWCTDGGRNVCGSSNQLLRRKAY